MKLKIKTTYKVILFAVLAVAAAYLVRYSYLSVAATSDSGSTQSLFEDELLAARAMFVEKSDDIQALTAALIDKAPLTLLRSADGSPMLSRDGEAVSEYVFEDEKTQASLDSVFGEYENGGNVLNIEVASDAVLFYTYYNNGGCVGFIYEKEAGATAYYDYFELLENWKLFYVLPS
jgi:hypothetical protein